MNVAFPPVDENFIKNKVQDGYYSNATELVRDAVRRLREQEDGKTAKLMAALEVGRQAVRDGRIEVYTPEFMDKIVSDARQYVAEGRIPDPDVCP